MHHGAHLLDQCFSSYPVKVNQFYIFIFSSSPDAKVITKGCNAKGFESLQGPTAVQLRDILDKLGMAKGRIGLEKGYEQLIGFQLNLYQGLKEQLPEVTFDVASQLIWNQRLIKSPKEIECIKRACEATTPLTKYTPQ